MLCEASLAHHQGMALVALGNVLNDRVMVERFHADPIIEATELLLQERMPRDVLVARPRAEEVKSAADVRDLVPPVPRRFTSPHDFTPRTHLLSNGRYAVMVTAAGSGYSRRDIAVTRSREDDSRAAVQRPLATTPARCGRRATSRPAARKRTATRWSTRRITSTSPVETADRDRHDDRGVSIEHDAEIRRVTLTNLGARAREIELQLTVRLILSSHRRPPIPRTRPSRTSSFRPSSSPRSAPCWRPAVHDPRASSRSGPPMSRWSRESAGGSSSTRPIAALASSDEAAQSTRRRPSSTGVRSYGGPGPGSDFQPPAPCEARPRRHRPRDLLDGGRRVPRPDST